MLYSEAKLGRVFIIRLEHGEIVHEQVELFAREHAIRAAALVVVGGVWSAPSGAIRRRS